jgi:hypothetical protein
LLFLSGAVWILSGRRLEQGSKTTFLFKIALASQPEESSRCFQRGGGYYQGILLPSFLQFSRKKGTFCLSPLWSLLHPISSQLLDHNQLRRALHFSS